MKGMFHWLSMNLSRSPASDTRSEQDASENGDGDVPATADGLMPDIYSQPTGDTQPLLKIIKDRSQLTDRSEGFDPYNTGSFDISKE